ncbi:MAG TPA: nucleotide sugar dehydrogenase [Candidatus Limnocylindria bacterium]|nr:nucleotide sugar dehydrogenase [Candidatus Limnocylindria bacterium]
MTAPRITVLGLWHLGCVTSACCAKHFDVTGLDFDDALISNLQQAKAPVFEPGLDELLAAGLQKNLLRFTTDPAIACAGADVLWVCYDTPVNEHDESDTGFVLDRIRRALPHLPKDALVLISSQLPVGTCMELEREFPQFHFAYSPENLRLGKAIDAFEKAERAVVGIRDDTKRALLEQLFKPFTPHVQFMRTESAEMVKHALNAFLGVSISFINEIARLCEHVGADAKEVSAGLKSEPRIGQRAYLGPGGPFAGGTLARDVVTLTKLGARESERLAIIPAIKQSNDEHRGWALRQIQSRLGDLTNRTVAVLGLVYTPNTNTLRRSAAVELCHQLKTAGAHVQAFDPVITKISPELDGIELVRGLDAALAQADAAVVCTEWPPFRDANWTQLIAAMRRALVVDANRFLEKPLQGVAGVEHISVGRA